MKEMPTAILPADSEYIYVPDSDSWIVQKKSGNKILSKKDIDRVPPMQDPFAPYQDVEQRGPKEISEYDPEYQYLVNLVNAVVKSGVPAREIKVLSETFPFNTIDDVSDLIGNIWNIAREKYHIPQEAIMKNMSKKKASLDKKAYEGGYPTEEDATTWGVAAPGTYAYQPNITHDSTTGLREGDDGQPITICPQCKSQRIDKESSPAKCLECGTDFVPKPDRGSDDPTVNDYSQNYWFGPTDLGRAHQHSPADYGWSPAGTEDMDGPSPNSRMSSFIGFMQKQSNLNKTAITKNYALYIGEIKYPAVRTLTRAKAEKILKEKFPEAYSKGNYVIMEEEFKTASLNKAAHCGPCSPLKMEALHTLIDLYYKDDSLFPKEVLEELSVAAADLKLNHFDDILESVIDEYLEEKAEEVGDKLPKLKNLLIALKDIAPKLGNEIEVVDKQAMLKQANPPSRFWIAPDGKEFPVAGIHPVWVNLNREMLTNDYGVTPKVYKNYSKVMGDMIKNGWVRISNEPAGAGFQIEVANTRNIPSYVDNFIAKYFKQGDTILIGDGHNPGIEITDPFPFIQKAVNKALGGRKQASLLDEVLDQTTQDAIAAEYGPQMLIAIRFYNDAVRYGQSPDRAMAYALEETKRMSRPIDQRQFLEVLNTYF